MDKTSVRKAEPDAPFSLINFSATVLIIAGILRVIDANEPRCYRAGIADRAPG